MATSPNITQITAPRVDLLDPQTGLVSREWYRFFYNLYVITGDGTGITAVINGGTGLGTIPTNGQLLIGNGTGYTLNTLGFGAGISVTNGSGTISVANTGVLSNVAGAGISVSSATGNVTIANTGVLSFSAGTTGLTPATATTGAVTLAGTLAIANGGTNGSATPTAYGIAYGTGTAYAFTAAGTTKQALLANTGAAPTWSTLTTGTSILYGDGSGGFSNVTIGTGVSFVAGTLSATGTGGTVTSVSGTAGRITSTGGTTPIIDLASGVATAGTTGSSTLIPVVTIDTYGRVTSITTAANPQGTVTSVSFTGGIITVATGTTTPAFTVAGTSGGIPYFSSSSTWATSAALAANALLIGGGAGAAPASITTGTGVVTALSVNTGSAGAFVVNGGALGTPSSGTVTNLTGTASININGTVGATTPAAGTFTSLSDSGNLTFTGTGNRITGDFTSVANGVYFQTSTANSVTNVGVIPNGTSPLATFQAYSSSDQNNSSVISIGIGTSGTEAIISSFTRGTGTALPLRFNVGGSERVRINTSGNVGIGTSSPSASAILDVQSTTKGVRMPNMTTVEKNAIATPAAGLMVFDTTLAKLCVYSGAAWQTITSI